MNLIPDMAEEVEVKGATVPFHKYEADGVVHYQFDSSKAGHPEPMVNAMSGLKILKDNEKLVMLNSKPPMGLFPKIENEFSFKHSEIAPGLTKVIFTPKTGAGSDTDFNDNSCAG